MDAPTPTPAGGAFARSVLDGLSRPRKQIEPRWLYDAVGAKLFEAITNLDTYYLTRAETALIETAAGEMANALGDGVTIVEPGSGEGLKVRPLLDALGSRAAGYVPIDVAASQLDALAATMRAAYPALGVVPVEANFFAPFRMPEVSHPAVFFAGSTIGNMTVDDGAALLRGLGESTGAERFLIGFDLVKDRRRMIDAYDDPAGVTAAFELNVLSRINRELGADFDVRAFRYDVTFDEAESAIVMQLVSRKAQSVTVCGKRFDFAEGEPIHTEDSRKFTPESFAALGRKAGLTAERTWFNGDTYAFMLLSR